jgi:hypothetical protein
MGYHRQEVGFTVIYSSSLKIIFFRVLLSLCSLNIPRVSCGRLWVTLHMDTYTIATFHQRSIRYLSFKTFIQGQHCAYDIDTASHSAAVLSCGRLHS